MGWWYSDAGGTPPPCACGKPSKYRAGRRPEDAQYLCSDGLWAWQNSLPHPAKEQPEPGEESNCQE